MSSGDEGCQWRRGAVVLRVRVGERNVNGSHSSLGTSAGYGEDREHDSLGMGLCTFYTELHVNVGKTWLNWDSFP